MAKRTKLKPQQKKQYEQSKRKRNTSANSTSQSGSSKKGKWTSEEDKLLSSLVKLYNCRNWKTISKNVPGRSSIQCLHRWTKILQPGLVKGPWTSQEDQKLNDWVKKHGATKWTLCAEGIPGRSGKQCREHWNNSLNPDVKKGSWSSEEDFLIMVFYKKYGGSWKKIIPIFNKRTENSIKNRFFSQLRKIASSFIQSKEKKFSAKIKLKTLLDYLDNATEKAKEKLLKDKPMNDDELEKFIDSVDVKLKKIVQMKKEGKNDNNNNNNNSNDNNKKLNINESLNFNENIIVNESNINDNNIEEKDDSISNNINSVNENVNNNNSDTFNFRKSNNISGIIFTSPTNMMSNTNVINTNLLGNTMNNSLNNTGTFSVLASLKSNGSIGNFNNFNNMNSMNSFGFQKQFSNLSNASFSALQFQEKPQNVNINNNITLNIKINQNSQNNNNNNNLINTNTILNNNNNNKLERSDLTFSKFPSKFHPSKEILINNNSDINAIQREIYEKGDNLDLFPIENEELFGNESDIDNLECGYQKKPSTTGYNGGRVFNNEIPNSGKLKKKISRQIKKDDNNFDNNQSIK